MDGRTFGNGWLFDALIGLLRHVSPKVIYVFEAVFVIPVTMMLSKGARLTYAYYNKVKGLGCWKSLMMTYHNNRLFGQTVVDKFAMYAGREFRVAYEGQEAYEKATRQPAAVLQLSAHIGCSEILGYTYRNNKPCNVLVYGGEQPAMMKHRQSAFGNRNIKMIPVATEGSHSEDIIRAFDGGEIVCAFADRFMSANKVIISTIHGHRVRLAKGPFSMAVNRGLTVFMANAMKENDGSYTAFFTPLNYDKTLPSKEQRQQLADAYCKEIERLLEKYPEQWFNYSDLWI